MSESFIQTQWAVGDALWQLGDFPKLMGIVNVTPDSFSDGGKWVTQQAAIDHALQLVEEGADILDIGGESTRPGSDFVSVSEELNRVIPVITELASRVSVPISIDTTKSEVAAEALSAGASIVNDISGLTFDTKIIDVCAAHSCGVIAMHIQGTPKTMQLNPHYDDAVNDIRSWLINRCDELESRGIARERIVIDPGIGFGKTAQHNLDILSNVAAFRNFGRPVLIGHSRKGFLKKLLNRELDERLAGTIGVSLALARQHVDILRVHDVRAVKDALQAFQKILGKF